MKILFCLVVTLCAASAYGSEKTPDWQKIPIPKPFIVCTTDADCDLTVELCGCCNFTAMNKRSVKKYAALERYCKDPPPPCKCEVPSKIAKCVKKLCGLVPLK